MKKISFGFLFLFACSPNLKPDRSNHPISTQTLDKPSHQKKTPDLVRVQNRKTGTDTDLEESSGTETRPSVDVRAKPSAEIRLRTEIKVRVGATSGTGTKPSVGAGTESRTEIRPSADVNTNSGTEAKPSADVNTVRKSVDRDNQELALNAEDDLIQKEKCEDFSKTDWTNQDLSIKQSVQNFTREQMENLLSINRDFPSPLDKEKSIRCFANTAFALNTIFKITTDHWWNDMQAPLQAPQKKILIEFIEHYFLAWIGYGLLLPVKSIPFDRIDFIVEEPRPSGDKQYKVVTNFTIMNSYSAEIAWIVDTQSFPKELAFLDIYVEEVSILYLLRKQMDYLFEKKGGNINEVVLRLQNKMDDSSFSSL